MTSPRSPEAPDALATGPVVEDGVARGAMPTSAVEAKPEEEAPPSLRGARVPSPGRYSLATGASQEMAAVRIDSTRGMPAVRPEMHGHPPSSKTGPQMPPPPPSSRGVVVPAPPSSGNLESGPSSRRATHFYADPDMAPLSKPITLAPPSNSAVPPPAPGAGLSASATPSRALRSKLTARQKTPPRNPPTPPKPPSVRPQPPSSATSPFDGFDEGSIAHAFDTLMSEEGAAATAGRHKVDMAPVRELFGELAAHHMRHVRDFMIDVKWGEATVEWIAICAPAVVSLRRAAERLEQLPLATSLETYGDELSACANGGPTITGSRRGRLLDAYAELAALLPQAFGLDRDRSQREAVIVQSLLLQVPDVRKVTIDKLAQAGLANLKALFEASPDEIAACTGIGEATAARIVERFQAYRREMKASPEDARAAERDRLAKLIATLAEYHAGYEAAAQGWSETDKAAKRDLFKSREEVWLAISVSLARFGETERLAGIEKVPFARRIALLGEYIEEARDKYKSGPDV